MQKMNFSIIKIRTKKIIFFFSTVQENLLTIFVLMRKKLMQFFLKFETSFDIFKQDEKFIVHLSTCV